MFYSRNTNNEISLLHERAPRLVYNDYESPFAKLLEKNNIQSLCTELYKI